MKSVVDYFHQLGLGDSAIAEIRLNVRSLTCDIFLSNAGSASSPRASASGDGLETSTLTFIDVRSISFPDGDYCLNYTVINYDAVEEQDFFVFRLEVTGGYDNDSFIRSIEIRAKNFIFQDRAAAKL